MKAYILTENDLQLLEQLISKWELKADIDYPDLRAANQPVGSVLRNIHYHLYSWIGDIKK